MKRKKNFISLIFSLLILFICGLLFSACGSSVDMSSVKSADDIEREKNVTQYKPKPEPKKEEPKSKPSSQEPTRKTTETKPTPTTSTLEPTRTQPAPSVTHSQSDTYLPDFMAFTNNTARVTSKEENFSFTCIKYEVDANRKAVQEYIDLITSKYNFKQTAFKQSSDVKIYNYGFNYTGTGSATKFDEKYLGKDFQVTLILYGFGNTFEVHVKYADGIKYTDTGDRTRYQLQEVKHNPQTSGGNSDNFDYPSGPEMRNAADEIRDKPCFRCDGRGYIEEFEYYNGPRYGNPPPPGVTVKKTCPDCNGRGRIDYNY